METRNGNDTDILADNQRITKTSEYK